MQYRVLCPAKINEFLAVGPRDERRFHPLETVFQEITLYDELQIAVGLTAMDFVGFERTPELGFEFEPFPANNTVSKAILLARTVIDFPPLNIRVLKRIPSKSGLGGASTDAAGILRFLKEFSKGALSESKCLEFASMVGADVSFFINGGRALGTGYGEILRPLNDTPPRWLVIARPSISCSTPEMYAKLDEADRPLVKYKGDLGHNDFERVAPCESLELADRLRALGAVQSGLSGSGSAVYGYYSNQRAAEWVGMKLQEEQVPFVHVGHSLPRHAGPGDGVYALDASENPFA